MSAQIHHQSRLLVSAKNQNGGNGIPHQLTVRQIVKITMLNRQTIINIKKRFWGILRNHYFNIESYGQLGLNGGLVEMDESKFKRKNNVGRMPQAGWVFGMIERGQNGKAIMIAVPDRRRLTLDPLIRRWVSPEASAVITDEWRSYRGLQRRMGLNHFTINHSRNFVRREPEIINNIRRNVVGRFIREANSSEEIPIHTQTIEAYWSNIKRIMKRKGGLRQETLQNHLNEASWILREKDDFIGSMSNLIRLSQI